MPSESAERLLKQARDEVRDRRPRDALRTLDRIESAPDAVLGHASTLRGHILRVLGDNEAAEAVLQGVVDRAGEAPFTAPAARALVELGWLRRRTDHAESERVMRRAVALADRSGDAEVRIATRCSLAEVMAMNADPAACQQVLDEAHALAHDKEGHVRVLITRGQVATHLGRLDDAERALRALVRLGGEMSSAAQIAHTGLAKLLLARGRADEALPHAREAVALAEGWGSKRMRATGYQLLGEVARGLGRLDDAERAYRAAEEIWERHEGMAVISRLNRAQVAVLAGRYAIAADLAANVLEHLGDTALVTSVARLAALPAALRADRDDEVRAVLAELDSRVPAGRVVHADLATLATVSARVATELGRVDDAVRLWALAHRQASALGRDRSEAAAALAGLCAAGAPIPVGGFLLREELGRGASGMVWRATHAATGEQVAVKLLTADAARTPEAVATFERELDAVVRLDHPNIVWLLDHGTLDSAAAAAGELVEGTPWLALELAADGTLDPECGQRPWQRCRDLLLALLDGLAHAHARGIVHLDLKPSNVLLDGGVPKLADFGLAQAPEVGGLRPAGTPAYMAPEQFRGEPLGPWTDLYALGCLATVLVQGAPPFDLASLREIREAHLTRLPPRLSPVVPVPDGLEPWIRRLLAKDPTQRFRRASDAARALRTLGEAPAGRSRPPAVRGPSPTSSRTTVVLPVEGVEALLVARDELAELCPVPAPEVPLRWDSGAPPRRPGLLGAGLALVGRRPPRPLARTHQRELLWAWLRQVAEQRRGALVVLSGPEGGGARHLARWLVERAVELGAADRVRSPADLDDRPGIALIERADEDPERLLEARSLAGVSAPILGLVTVPPEHVEDVVAGLDEHVLWLETGALDPASVRAVVETILPLSEGLAALLVEGSENLPGRAIRRLRQLAADGQLVPRADGWDLRPGAA